VAARPYHHGSLVTALTEAALAAAAEGGADALVLRDLAATVGVSPSATYRHFPSREHLLAHVAQCIREDLARALEAARSEVPATGTRSRRAERRFAATGRAYVRYALDHPRWFELAFAPCAEQPAGVDDPSAWDVLVGAIDEMVETGAMPGARADTAPLIAWSGVHGLATILTASASPRSEAGDPVIAGPDRVAMEASIDAVVDAIVRSVR